MSPEQQNLIFTKYLISPIQATPVASFPTCTLGSFNYRTTRALSDVADETEIWVEISQRNHTCLNQFNYTPIKAERPVIAVKGYLRLDARTEGIISTE